MGPKGLGFCPPGPSQLSCGALCLPGYLLLFRDSSTWMGPVDVKEKTEAPAGREGHPAWGGTCRVPVAGTCLVSPCPLGPGEPPQTTTSRTPSTLQGALLQPLSSLQGSFLLPGQVLGHPGWPPTLQGPPLFSSFLSPPRSLSSVGPLIPQPGALSALWTGPSTIGDPCSTLWLPPPSRGPPSILQDPSPSRAASKGTHCPRRSCECRREGRQSLPILREERASIRCSPTPSAPGSLLETQVLPSPP